jgi:hypothetical protein
MVNTWTPTPAGTTETAVNYLNDDISIYHKFLLVNNLDSSAYPSITLTQDSVPATLKTITRFVFLT